MKAAVRWLAPFVAVFLAAYLFVLGPRLEEIEELRDSVARLKEEYVSKKRQAVNLDLLRDQLRQAEALLGKLLTALPTRFDRGFTHLLAAASSRGVRVEELRLEGEINRDFYAQLAVRIKARGRFHDLGAFAADLALAPGSLLLQEISLDPSPTPGQVTMQATVRTFRYLDDDEVAAQRKRAMAAKGAKR